MKSPFLSIFFFLLLAKLPLMAQDFEKMNKSELRGLVINLLSKQDSLQTICYSLDSTKKLLLEKLNSIELKNNANEAEVTRLLSLIEKNRIEAARTKLEHEKVVIEAERAKLEYEKLVQQLNATITSLRDTLSNLSTTNTLNTNTADNTEMADTTASVATAQINRNDFLNKYFFDQFPLTNHSFELVLTKVIYGDVSKSASRGYYDDDDDKGGVVSIPEILDVNAFTFWGIQANKRIDGDGNISSYTFARRGDYLGSRLPKIEVLKNKLFTFKYPTGQEESFLFNIKQTGVSYNNYRKVLQIELANEDVKSDGTNNTAKDIVWRIYAIENECYLALSIDQLSRLNLQLRYVVSGRNSNSNYSISYKTTTGDEIFLSRNEDVFMPGARYVDPQELIYLFKLK